MIIIILIIVKIVFAGATNDTAVFATVDFNIVILVTTFMIIVVVAIDVAAAVDVCNP